MTGMDYVQTNVPIIEVETVGPPAGLFQASGRKWRRKERGKTASRSN